MCMMCGEELNYRAYLAYVDYIEAEEAAGRIPDIDKAMDVAQAVIDAAGFRNHEQPAPSPLSPFYCEPVEKK
jgi:hypothetical protein